MIKLLVQKIKLKEFFEEAKKKVEKLIE